MQHNRCSVERCGYIPCVIEARHDGHSVGDVGDPWIDTLALARQAWPKAPSHKLEDLTAGLKLEARVRELAAPDLAAWAHHT